MNSNFLIYEIYLHPFSNESQACDICKQVRPAPGQRVVENDLHILETSLSPAGKPVRVPAINGGIPGPTLRFSEGDFARIREYNDLKHETTSTHWHGPLLPNKEHGVPHVTTPLILLGTMYTFQFTLRHGSIYGSIMVEPHGGERVKADREKVLLFSDWTDTDPREVMRMLMRGSDNFGQTRIHGRPGEHVRLRLINAAAATYFYLHSSADSMTIVAADGLPVQPVKVDRFMMAIAETYDVIIAIPPAGAYEFRATTQDGSGLVSAFFGSGTPHPANDPPKPDLYQMDETLALALEEKEDDPRASLNLPRPGSPYRILKSVLDTSLPGHLPRRKISLHLTGDMSRYVWSFDGKTMAKQPYVTTRKGEIIELELVNDTMMHHPIHLHGHFFRLLMGNG